MQRKNYFFLLFFLGLLSCSTYTLTDQHQGKLVDYSSATPDTGIQNLINPYSEVYQSSMNETVGYLAQDMEKGFPEGDLGNFFADIFYDLALNDPQFNSPGSTNRFFCLFNNGGLRVPLQKGVVTRGKIFELMPFENVLVAVQLKGSDLEGLTAYLLEKKGQPVSSNVHIEFSKGKNVRFEVNGAPIDPGATYTVLTSDYLAAGGDNMEFFKKGTLVNLTFSVKLRDGVINHFQKYSGPGKPLTAPLAGRIKIE